MRNIKKTQPRRLSLAYVVRVACTVRELANGEVIYGKGLCHLLAHQALRSPQKGESRAGP